MVDPVISSGTYQLREWFLEVGSWLAFYYDFDLKVEYVEFVIQLGFSLVFQ